MISWKHSFFQILSFSIALLTISGCQAGSQNQSQTTSTASVIPKCPTKPLGVLETKNIKSVPLETEIVKESGQVSDKTFTGYTFSAKAGQKLSYHTPDNLCLWVFSPNLEILNGRDLPQTGKYTIQLAAPSGSQTFSLEMTVGTLDSPEQVIREHYTDLNNRQYEKTWKRLSAEFKTQQVPNGYSEYLEWWNSVRRIDLARVTQLKSSGQQAIIDADMQYIMKNGQIIKDSKRYIYLVYEPKSDSWQIDNKTEELITPK